MLLPETKGRAYIHPTIHSSSAMFAPFLLARRAFRVTADIVFVDDLKRQNILQVQLSRNLCSQSMATCFVPGCTSGN